MAKEVAKRDEKIDPATGEIMAPNSGEIDIPSDAMDLLDKYQGQGYSQNQEDGLTPILSVLQDNSGEVKKNHERRIDGAEAGMLIIRSLRALYDGQKGVLIQPFGFYHAYIEWSGEPGEGVPVGRFPFHEPPNDAFETQDPQVKERKILRRKSTMNRLVDTREHFVNLVDGINRPFPIVIPMSGSNHSVSRLFTNMMRNMVYQGKQIPSFFRLYTLRTVFKKKGANQTWFGFQLDPSSFIKDRDLLQLGADLCEQMKEKPIEGNLSDIGGEIDDAQATAHSKAVDASKVI